MNPPLSTVTINSLTLPDLFRVDLDEVRASFKVDYGLARRSANAAAISETSFQTAYIPPGLTFA